MSKSAHVLHSKRPAFSRPNSCIEALEGRIAPAILVAGGNLLGGAGNPSTGEYSLGDNSQLYVKVTSGQAVVWFDGDVITGISVGPNIGLEVVGNVYGDIVANLDASGRLTDSNLDPTDGLDGGILLPNSISSIKIKRFDSVEPGSVGNIVTGGSISGVNVAAIIQGLYAGDGVFHATSDVGSFGSFTFDVGIDVNPIVPGTQTFFTLDKADAKMTPGASIKSSSIGIAMELQVIAGSGNPTNASFTNTAGPAGGSIDGLTILTAKTINATSLNPSYELIAGDGATGKVGGAGGSINRLIEKSAKGVLVVRAGNGGAGIAGAGGAGGSVLGSDFGSLSGVYTVVAGDGGSGTPGGAGGSAKTMNFANVSATSSLVAAVDLDGDGTDELVTVEASSGDFVVTHSPDNGTTFNLVRQYTNATLDPVYVVDGGGIASDLDIADINNDGRLDVVVTYSNSGGITAYLNQGSGVFYSVADEAYKTRAFSFTDSDGFSAKYTEVIGNHLVVAGTSKTKTRILTIPIGETAPPGIVVGTFDGTATAMTSNPQGDAFAGFSDGTLVGIRTSGSFSTVGTALGGAISSLAIGDDGNTLAALSKDRKVSVFTLSTGATATLRTTLDLTSAVGVLQQVKFIADDGGPLNDRLVVSRVSSVASYDVYQPSTGGTTYALGTTLIADSAYKQFDVAAMSDGAFGFGSVTSAANSLGFSKNLGVFAKYGLPFNGKQVTVASGRGGDGVNFGNTLGKGGAGGPINSVNIEAVDITLSTGDGGDSLGGAAGAAGSISNGVTMTTVAGTIISPALRALEKLSLTGGAGGEATGTLVKSASGGAGGGFSGLKLELEKGQIKMFAGDGGAGNGGSGGAGGAFSGIKATGKTSDIRAYAGDGGATAGIAAKAGAGGGFSNFTFILQNEEATEIREQTYTVELLAGNGGSNLDGIGGAGGGFFSTTLSLDGADRTYNGVNADNVPVVDANLDSTVIVTMTAGKGGNGVTGGKGGDVAGTKLSTIHDQILPTGRVLIHYIVAGVTAGNGGTGSTGNGGAGGSVNASTFTGVTYFDKDASAFGTPLFVQAGKGGTGGNKGGAGGAVATLIAQNAPPANGTSLQSNHLGAVEVYAGNGGDGGNSDGGAGGALSGITISASQYLFTVAGNGGNGGVAGGTTAKGGAGGQVASSTLAVVNAPVAEANLIATAGHGGSGRAAGGIGGAINTLTVNLPFAPSGLGAILTAGDGGSASGAAALGGKGGDVTGITNAKDIHSAISLIEAGNGGDAAAGKGGGGGNVSKVRVAGFIGRVLNNVDALGAFDINGTVNAFGTTIHTNLVTGAGIAQGIFVGRGGTGATAGLAGSVTAVQAEGIAAIGAAVDANGVFGLAEKVTSVKASLIGYDVDGDHVFNTGNPGSVRPTDGFILAKALAQVVVNNTLILSETNTTTTPLKPAFVFVA